MTEKLKPEHRKLWRRIYLLEYERCGQTQSCAAEIADDVVAQWEERGAFDEDAHPAPLTIDAWRLIATTLRDKFPSAYADVYRSLQEDRRSVMAWDDIVAFGTPQAGAD